ncbi:MAG TPA: matrixin family metalloprotease [Pyrinomonadaceae bacterium]|nr:matrixin family metalloprotease [Pyrinomonadaceae bacterium]
MKRKQPAVVHTSNSKVLRMTPKKLGAVLSLLVMFGVQMPLRGYTLQYRDNSGIVMRRWLTHPIIIAFSASLVSPPSNIKSGSDVLGAARRALQHWSSVADIDFLETSSSLQTISPQSAGDRINLITVSDQNSASFGTTDNPGRTRTFYDSGGAIVEADIALNPNVAFSSDGTPGTYDLESTFTHEVGHLLGLEHSAVLGATMQPRQAMNGLFNLPAFTQRTLSEDDIAGARTLYGSRAGTGSIFGRLISNSFAGQSHPIFGGHVFAEDALTGRVVAGNVTLASGSYRIDALPPGRYHIIGQTLDGLIEADEIATANGSYAGLFDTAPPFRTQIAVRSTSQVIPIVAGSARSLGFFVSSNPAPGLKPRLIGMNGELSTVALPLSAGKTFTVYIAGEGIDEIPFGGVSSTSPFIRVIADSLAAEEFDTPYPVISFEITVAPDIPPGEYSLLLQSSEGELAYLVGALTIE